MYKIDAMAICRGRHGQLRWRARKRVDPTLDIRQRIHECIATDPLACASSLYSVPILPLDHFEAEFTKVEILAVSDTC